MALTQLFNEPLTSSLANVPSLQCNGGAVSGASAPSGVPGYFDFVADPYGTTCLRTTMYTTDPPTFTGIRSETVWNAAAIGDENWITWQMLLASSEFTINSAQIVVGQMHCQDAISAAVNFAFTVRGTQLAFSVPASDPPTQSGNSTIVPVCDIRLDHWYTFAVHAIWQNNDNGILEAFVDDMPVYRVFSRGTCYNSDAPYLKLGIYDGAHTNSFGAQQAARFRNVKIWSGAGADYETVMSMPPQVDASLLAV